MKAAEKILGCLKVLTSFGLVATAVVSLAYRIPQCFRSQTPAALAAAAFSLTDGEYKIITESQEQKETVPEEDTNQNTENTQEQQKNTLPKVETVTSNHSTERDKSDYYDSYGDHTGEEKYEIAENTYFGGGTEVENFSVKNKTGVDYDFASILNNDLTFDVSSKSDEPQVLIYHTHTTEGYMDEDVDFFYDSFYSRTQDGNFSVVAVGDAISDVLNKRGIKTIHDKTIHDSTYDGSYDRSSQTVETYMKKYDSIKVVLDIHRDAIGTDERKIKPVFTYNGKKAAQIMILSGCDDGSNWFPNWQNNLNFALKIQNKAEELYEGMTRPLSFDYFRYNEYVCDGSLLIEVGTEANSVDEAVYAGELLGNVLAEVFKS